jgi:membrane protease YdiL (CAAX protease family)
MRGHVDQETVIKEVKIPSSPQREYIVTFVAGALVIAFLWFYQYHWHKSSYEEYIAVTIGVLLFLPLLSILLPMRSTPETFGMTPGDFRLNRRYAAGLLLVMIPFLWISAHTSGAMEYYPLFRQYASSYPLSWTYVLYFEALYGVYLFAWEWFFRGFLLFGLARKMGSWSLFAQAIPFGMLHYGKPMPEFIGSFVAGLVLGFVAMRTGSFIAGFLTHWTIAVLYDLMVLLVLAQQGIRLF